jgi:hypothetical protein
MLSVFYGEYHSKSVMPNFVMLSVVMLGIVMLNVVAYLEDGTLKAFLSKVCKYNVDLPFLSIQILN